MKPDSKKGFICLKMMMMKIPMTVFGGLQYCSFVIIDFSLLCFNTDDGIRRATMVHIMKDLVFGKKFQYR